MSYVGYEEQVIPTIIVMAGKEVILDLVLTESVAQLNEVVIVTNNKDDKTATKNDIAAVSAGHSTLTTLSAMQVRWATLLAWRQTLAE